MKWNPDKSNSSKNNAETKLLTTNENCKTSNVIKKEYKYDDPATPDSKHGEKHFHQHSIDDSFFIRSTSILSRTTSRRSHTPTPSLRRSNSRSLNMISSLKRSMSRKRAATTPSTLEIPDITLAKLMSQNNNTNNTTPTRSIVARSLSNSASRRSTTPIIFSQSIARKKPQPIEKKLECSLEELCFGATKKIVITRDIISDSGKLMQEEEILQINIKPGWKKGTKVTFEGKGDQKPGYLPADIVFLIEEKRHPVFKRIGDDLELGVEVPLLKALVGFNMSLPLLGGEKMFLKIDEVLHPGFEKVIQNQGMAKSKEEGERGELRLKFLVKFPKELSDNQRSRICNILEGCF